jgi:hypothetical protein
LHCVTLRLAEGQSATGAKWPLVAKRASPSDLTPLGPIDQQRLAEYHRDKVIKEKQELRPESGTVSPGAVERDNRPCCHLPTHVTIIAIGFVFETDVRLVEA